jgi:hypothetical protein
LPLAVLIIAGENGNEAGGGLAPMFRVVGQTLLEYQVRLARVCGGGHIVVLVEHLPAAMIAVFDSLRNDGIDVDVARDARDAADRVHPDEQVLLLTSGLVVSRTLIESLVLKAQPTLVTLPDQPDNIIFERIDATERWTGLALLGGQTIRETAAMLGDWSIGSTLMRNALQSGAARWRLDKSDGINVITTGAQATAVSAKLVRDSKNSAESQLADLIAQPLAKLFVPLLLRWSVPIDLVAVMPLVLLGTGLLLAMVGWFGTGFAVLCLASFTENVAALLLNVAVRGSSMIGLLKYAKPITLGGMLLALGWAMSVANDDWAALLLAGWAISLFLLRRADMAARIKWLPSIGSSTLIMLLALLFSVPLAGLILLVCHGLAGQIADRFFTS